MPLVAACERAALEPPLVDPETEVEPEVIASKVIASTSVEFIPISWSSPATIASMLARTLASLSFKMITKPVYLLFLHFHPFRV